jgi:hypothetical protein
VVVCWMSTTLSAAPIGTLIISQALFSSFAIGASAAFAQDKAEEAWWLTATFVPNQTEYLSLRAAEIDPNWTALSPLNTETLPKGAAGDLDWMKRDGFRFSSDRMLTDGRSIHIAVGVYRTQDNGLGRFLLVMTKPASGSWQVKLLHKEPGDPGFSVLRTTKSGTYWGTCMLCSGFRRIIADKDSYRLQ